MHVKKACPLYYLKVAPGTAVFGDIRILLADKGEELLFSRSESFSEVFPADASAVDERRGNKSFIR